MTAINKQTLSEMRSAIDSALLEVGKRYGVQFQLGKCRFTSTNAEFKLAVNAKTDTGAVINREQADFVTVFGAAKGEIKFALEGQTGLWHGVGYCSGKKYNVLVENVADGRRLRITSDRFFRLTYQPKI
jgi:hypothetical protein